MTRRGEQRRDHAAAQRLLGYLFRSLDGPKTDDDLLVEAWLWMVLGEDDAAVKCLAAREALDGQDTKWEALS